MGLRCRAACLVVLSLSTPAAARAQNAPAATEGACIASGYVGAGMAHLSPALIHQLTVGLGCAFNHSQPPLVAEPTAAGVREPRDRRIEIVLL